MKTSDFNYDLPQELIAQHPIEPRDSSRLLVYNRASRQIEDKHFYEIIDYLKSGDVLVVNNTKVIPARIYGNKEKTGGKIEFLLLKRLTINSWEVVLKPGRIAKVGARFVFGEGILTATIDEILTGGVRVVTFSYNGVFEDILRQIGEMPLPHYITEKLTDSARYNTVYSKIDGSAAAPTAGLHFTNELLEKIKAKGIQIVEVLLHVGLGTFRPVKVEDVTKHEMHYEYYEVTQQAASAINLAKQQGRRVIAVGTTSVRVLESSVVDGKFVEGRGQTNIFIYPPYQFKIVDGLITNFHLPESTLIMLVSAFCSRDEVLRVYKHAVDEKYRFFSFGDSSFFI